MSAADIARPSLEDAATLLSELVAIESINPSLVPGGSGEAEIATFIARWLERAGLQVEVQEVAPGRPNVIGRVQGRASGRSMLLNAHMDTVGVAGMDEPFRPVLKGDLLYGRGAYDMKAGLAAIMLCARAIAALGGANGDLIVTAVMDEEYASLGTEQVLQTVRADGAIVTEPTALRLCMAHKGFAWLSVETRGRASHGSRPDLGVDAIAHMGRVLVGLEALENQLRERSPHPLLGHGSLHASLIEGGQELSSYPERCRLQVERRTIPGERAEDVRAEIDEILVQLASADPSFQGGVDLSFWREPFEVGEDDPVVRALAAAAGVTVGKAPEVYGDTVWMDAALLAAAGIPTVVMGPGGAGAHAVTEYASIAEVAACAEILTRTALDFCG